MRVGGLRGGGGNRGQVGPTHRGPHPGYPATGVGIDRSSKVEPRIFNQGKCIFLIK